MGINNIEATETVVPEGCGKLTKQLFLSSTARIRASQGSTNFDSIIINASARVRLKSVLRMISAFREAAEKNANHPEVKEHLAFVDAVLKTEIKSREPSVVAYFERIIAAAGAQNEGAVVSDLIESLSYRGAGGSGMGDLSRQLLVEIERLHPQEFAKLLQELQIQTTDGRAFSMQLFEDHFVFWQMNGQILHAHLIPKTFWDRLKLFFSGN